MSSEDDDDDDDKDGRLFDHSSFSSTVNYAPHTFGNYVGEGAVHTVPVFSVVIYEMKCLIEGRSYNALL